MERLHFDCPNTGEVIDVGIESELDTLLRIRDKRVLARCPRCGERHEWRVADAPIAEGGLTLSELLHPRPQFQF